MEWGNVLYQLFFKQGQDSMFIIRESDGIIVKVNDAAVKAYGYTREEMLEMRVEDLFDLETFKAIESIRGGLSNESNVTTRHCRKDSSAFPVEVGLKSAAAEEGKLLFATVRDMTKHGPAPEKTKAITEQKLAEETLAIAVQRKWSEEDLRHSEEKLRITNQQLLDIIDFLPDATFVIDRDGRVIAWNHAIEEITGVPKKGMLGKGDYAYAVPFYGKPRPILIDLVFTEEREIKLLYDYVRKEGDTFFGETFVPSAYLGKGTFLWGKASPLFDHDGNIVGAIESIRDISSLKHLEELTHLTGNELKQALEKLDERELMDRIIRTSPAGILVVNSKMEVVFANTRAEQLLGLNIKSENPRVYQKPLWFVTDEKGNPILDEDFVYMQVIISGKQVFDVEQGIQWPDGTRKLLSINGAPLFDRSGRVEGAVLSIEDKTGRKEAEERIINYQSQLRSLAAKLSLAEERERRRIAEGIHDQISQSLAISRLKIGELKRAASIDAVLENLDEIIFLIEDVIMKTRSLTFELSPPILYELGFGAAVEWLAEQLLEKNGLQVFLKNELASAALKEEVRVILFSSVRELFFNIVKHAGAHKVNVSIKNLGMKVRIVVEDDGTGFNARLFGPMPGKPDGYGLFSVKERLEHLGGRMEIISGIGHGTSIVIEAPLKNDD
ncbi:PAS domain-containing sensor histidine kinase [Pelotomaculum propionicicum]|uniref:PAS domain-containing sensor histidine kinase n=1 Tax=Pelotomaculum propionicicum TaxID=258475 RepID=UPI001065A403|nr:PAS domain S-box protein [Pelotomaculum propionicicum]